MSNPGLQTSDEHVALFIARVRERIYRYLYGPRPAFLAPVGWVLTFQVSAISAMWYISMIPLRISLDIYERHIRAIFPQLPSIRQKLLSLRTTVLEFFPKSPSPLESRAASSSASSRSHQGTQSTNASASPLPTLDVDLDAIRAGTTSSTPSTSNIQLITDALVDYAKVTGIDLSKNLFAVAIESANSPGDILELLQEREKPFKDYREGNRSLISCLSPAVNVIQAFSDVLGEAVNLVPFPPANALFVGIVVLLSAASGVTLSYDALLDLFECLGNFLKRLEVYTTIPPTPMMMDLTIKNNG
ncbi:hypothetical protein BGY98DRAFT_1097197 [Russula aff. rugulosa BPL654]|nr:hypothetical protein BGY98DRAFT_1097197 [Russula aff. rugulosa BPL654]